MSRTGASVLALVLLGLGGCALLRSLGSGERPGARLSAIRLDRLELTGASLVFDVEIRNPYEVDLPLLDLEYALSSEQRRFLAGRAEVTGAVPARGSRVIALPARVVFADLLAVLSGVRPGAVIPYLAFVEVSVDAPVIGRLELPVRREGTLPIPTAPSVRVSAIQWEKLTLDEAAASLDLDISNTNDFPLNLVRLSYALSLGGTSVAQGRIEQPLTLERGSEGPVTLRLDFAPRRLGAAVFQLLSGGKASYRLTGGLECNTPFGSIDFPYERGGETRFTRPTP